MVRNFYVRWFESTNHKDIAVLYLIFGGFSGILGTTFSVMIRFVVFLVFYLRLSFTLLFGSNNAITDSAEWFRGGGKFIVSKKVKRRCKFMLVISSDFLET